MSSPNPDDPRCGPSPRAGAHWVKTGILGAALVALSAVASYPAFARHPSVTFGFQFGVPLYDPWYYPPYYYPYYPPVYYPPAYYPPVIQAPAPSAYIEQQRTDDAHSWWYYCAQSKAYYPYVKTCPGPWERVSPRPPG